MHAVTNAVSLKLTGVTARVSAKVARRAQKVALRASVDDEAVTFTADDLSKGLKAADAAWEEKAAEPAAAPVAFSAAIDPADGSVAEAAPLGDDMSMLNDAMIAFKEPRAVEIINGRVAMIGWMASSKRSSCNAACSSLSHWISPRSRAIASSRAEYTWTLPLPCCFAT